MSKDPLAKLVDDYRSRFRAHDQLAFYASLDSLELVIDYAALSKRPDGKRHSHQRRLQLQNMLPVKERLLDNREQLRTASSFAAIYQLVRACAGRGFGELAIYDTALRLGAYLNKLPDYVYLHAGTRKGAATLGLKVNREYLALDELPAALRVLKPYEAEDFLCIYKDHLKNPEVYADTKVVGCNKPDLPEDRCNPTERAEITPTSRCSS